MLGDAEKKQRTKYAGSKEKKKSENRYVYKPCSIFNSEDKASENKARC